MEQQYDKPIGPREADIGDVIDALSETGDMMAASLVGRIMEHNARSNSALLDDLLQGEIRAHEETKERLREAHDRLDVIAVRMHWLLGGEGPFMGPWSEDRWA